MARKQLYWEDVKEGSQVTPLAKVASSQMLVKWAGASGDFNPIHYEDTIARAQKLDRPIVHGQLKRAWLVQLLTDWIGDDGFVKRFACQFRAVDYPRLMKSLTEPADGETWWCKGNVTRKYVENDEHLVDCDIWLENGKGDKTTTGSATVILPSRA